MIGAEVVTAAARAIKLDVEIPRIRQSIAAVEQATAQMESAIAPGKTENEIWAHFHHGVIERDAEYVSTRLFTAGERSFPYFRESGPNTVSSGF